MSRGGEVGGVGDENGGRCPADAPLSGCDAVDTTANQGLVSFDRFEYTYMVAPFRPRRLGVSYPARWTGFPTDHSNRLAAQLLHIEPPRRLPPPTVPSSLPSNFDLPHLDAQQCMSHSCVLFRVGMDWLAGGSGGLLACSGITPVLSAISLPHLFGGCWALRTRLSGRRVDNISGLT
jgi:hypothetical protein